VATGSGVNSQSRAFNRLSAIIVNAIAVLGLCVLASALFLGMANGHSPRLISDVQKLTNI